MFSFTADTVLDPFMGTGTTLLAAARCGRNGIGVEVDDSYLQKAKSRLESETDELFTGVRPYVVKRRAAAR
jgi:DNA modification methylase